MRLEDVLARMYASEINARIGCFWDGGWDVWLGDELNGWKEKVSVDKADEIASALNGLIVKHYPDSSYARQAALDAGLQVQVCEVCGRSDLLGVVNGYACWRCGQLWLEANFGSTPYANAA